jgi:hypothetical protein
MNWKIHRPRTTVSFSEGEPICFLQPFDVGKVESMDPEVRPLDSAPKLAAAYDAWRDSRAAFHATPARDTAWQKHYYRGREVTGKRATDHKTSVHVRPFKPVTVV